MTALKSILLALLGIMLACSPVLSQQQQQIRTNRGARYLGYVPAHVRQNHPGEPNQSPSRREGQPTPAVASVSHQQPVDPVPAPPADANQSTTDEGMIYEDEAMPLEGDMWHEDAFDDHQWSGNLATSCGTRCFCLPTVCITEIWGRAEYLVWSTQGMNIPPLATTSPAGTAQNLAGVLGVPGTRILFGNSEVDDDARSGIQFTLGAWLDPCRCHGVQASYLWLDDESESFAGSQNNFDILARPFFNAQTNAQDARQIVFPNVVDGSLNIQTTTEFESLELLFRRLAIRNPCTRVDLLVGYRYAKLDDSVLIDESTIALAEPIAGSTIDLLDQFESTNRFHGGVLGLSLEWCPDSCWSCEFVAKVALGSTESQATVSGQTVARAADGEQTFTGAGLLTQATNIGSYSDSRFATLSEFGVTMRRQLFCDWQLTIGYTFLFWSEVSRAGDEIDLAVNPTQIPPGMLSGAARPAFDFDFSGFWAQGLRLGLEYRF
jgi:hypothetical protein